MSPVHSVSYVSERTILLNIGADYLHSHNESRYHWLIKICENERLALSKQKNLNATKGKEQKELGANSLGQKDVAHFDAENPTASHDAGHHDHFIRDEEGTLFAGRHLIIDLFGVASDRLTDRKYIEDTFKEATKVCGATLLSMNLHCFEPNGGITGVAILAESHISIHTWPERNFAAVDVFMCGDAKPEKSLRVLQRAFNPHKMSEQTLKRGIMNG